MGTGYNGICSECEGEFQRKRWKGTSELDERGRSREPEYCSGKCRQKAYRKRQAAQKALELENLRNARPFDSRSETQGKCMKCKIRWIWPNYLHVLLREASCPKCGTRLKHTTKQLKWAVNWVPRFVRSIK